METLTNSKKLVVISFVFLLHLLATTSAWADFIVVGHKSNHAATAAQLFIYGEAGSTGTISSLDTSMNQSFTIPASGTLEITLNSSWFFQPSEIDTLLTRALLIESDSVISGSLVNQYTGSSDVTTALDIDALGTSYRLVTYASQTQFSVTATEDNTTVSITPNANLTSGQLSSSTFNKTLNAGESYYFESANDLTASLIESDKPIAVFSGNPCARVPTGANHCDHLFMQLPPTNYFANTFVIAETAKSRELGGGDTLRVIAHTDNTVVTVNGIIAITLNAGQNYELSTAYDTVIETSQPVLVAQYLKGNGVIGIGDPSLTFIPAADQLLDSYVFSTPIGAAAFTENYLNIAIPTTALSSLTLDGSVVDTSSFTAIGSSGYSAGNILVAEGAGKIEADEPFNAILSGYLSVTSYLTFIATTYSEGASITTITPVVPSLANPSKIPSLSWVTMLIALSSLGMLGWRKSRD